MNSPLTKRCPSCSLVKVEGRFQRHCLVERHCRFCSWWGSRGWFWWVCGLSSGFLVWFRCVFGVCGGCWVVHRRFPLGVFCVYSFLSRRVGHRGNTAEKIAGRPNFYSIPFQFVRYFVVPMTRWKPVVGAVFTSDGGFVLRHAVG
jgi:hypothetical protein